MKNGPVRHGKCDNIIFSETFCLGSSNEFLDLPLGDSRILLTDA